MAERLTTNQEVPGSTPGWIVSFSVFFFYTLLFFSPGFFFSLSSNCFPLYPLGLPHNPVHNTAIPEESIGCVLLQLTLSPLLREVNTPSNLTLFPAQIPSCFLSKTAHQPPARHGLASCSSILRTCPTTRGINAPSTIIKRGRTSTPPHPPLTSPSRPKTCEILSIATRRSTQIADYSLYRCCQKPFTLSSPQAPRPAVHGPHQRLSLIHI